MHPLTLLLIAALSPITSPAPRSTDPLQACARKALAGEFGKLRDWQQSGYQQAIDRGATVQGLAWVTSYYPAEGFPAGQHTRSGRGVSIRSAAVCRKHWKREALRFVWTNAYGLRIVEDTGADSNERHAKHKRANRWIDVWFPRNHPRNPVTPYAIFGRSK